jgi:hypothetical protein
LTGYEAIEEVVGPIRIMHPDKAGAQAKELGISSVMYKVMYHLEASYAALGAVFGVLYGST